jgi:hypothetical protein
MKNKAFLAVMLAVFLLGGQASAHHSFAATYQVDKVLTIKGKMVQFLYRNPHSFVKVEAADDTGEVQTWSIEWGGGAQLNHDHVTRETLKAGDYVIVIGNPGRDPTEHRLRMHSISRPSDGWKWQGVVE